MSLSVSLSIFVFLSLSLMIFVQAISAAPQLKYMAKAGFAPVRIAAAQALVRLGENDECDLVLAFLGVLHWTTLLSRFHYLTIFFLVDVRCRRDGSF